MCILNFQNLKQSSVFRIDERVVYSMIAISVLAVIILAFKLASGGNALQVRIEHNDSAFTNTPASFRVAGPKGKMYEWNFGDSSIESYTDTIVMHKYKKAGTYIVIVTVDGLSEEIIKQDVYAVPEVIEESPETTISFKEPSYVNDLVIFSVNLPSNASVEWYFEGKSQPSGTGNTISQIFDKRGTKKIELKINPRTKDEKVLTRYININEKDIESIASNNNVDQGSGPATNTKGRSAIIVKDKPTEPGLVTKNDGPEIKVDPVKPDPPVKPTPPVVTAPEISQTDFESLLHKIKTDDKPLRDFSQYLCGHLEMPVVFNGKQMTFTDMYNEIKDAKRRKAKKISVDSFQTNGTTHCIKTLTVSL